MKNMASTAFRTLFLAGASLGMLGTTACDTANKTSSTTTESDPNAAATAMEAADEKSRVDAEMGGIQMHDEMTDKDHADAGMGKDKMGEDHMKMDNMDKIPPNEPAKVPPKDMPMKDDM